jgi:S-adenosylmethionine hydrolase
MPMIFLFTDFGSNGPYVGQMHAVLKRAHPHIPVIDLMHDAPAFDPKCAAYLLPAYTRQAQAGDVVIAVVDPGVGSARACIALKADGVWYVGPDNGLFSQVQARATTAQAFRIPVPQTSSATFHGRDVFAPAAAQLIAGAHEFEATTLSAVAWPADLDAVVYIDAYGNALTGRRVETVARGTRLKAGGGEFPSARTFSDVSVGQCFWYGNSNGLVEIAVNGGNAAKTLGLSVGCGIEWV